jgi:hypothetical protein
MGLFDSEMTSAKAVEMLGSENSAKVEKGIEFLKNLGTDSVPFLIDSFQDAVSQAERSKRHSVAALNLYNLLCDSRISADLCPRFLKALVSAPSTLNFNLSLLPTRIIEDGYYFLEHLLSDGDTEQKKKVIPLLKLISLPPSVLPALASLLDQKSGVAEEALFLISVTGGDLSPVSDALYEMLDLYPLGDSAAKVIPELGNQLPPNLTLLRKYLADSNSLVQRRAIRISIPLAEVSSDVYAVLEDAIYTDESARTHILEALEKIESLSPEQMDLVWMILVRSSSPLTEERGMKYFARLGSPIIPLVRYYAQNGNSDEIICSFKCIGYMTGSGARVCTELLPIFLNDEILLFDTAGYPSFPYIAQMMKQHCSQNPATAALAKKMRDYCVRRELNTPAEVMALLGPLDLTDVLEWSFSHIFDAYGVGYSPEYVDKLMTGISELVNFDKMIFNSFIKAVGYVYTFDSFENKPILSHKDTAAAINRLRSVNTLATSNFLHLISRKKDVRVFQTDASGIELSSFVLSFEEHRKLAMDELERRNFPPYRPINYLKNPPQF